MINFVKLFPKDMKYFMGENFEFDEGVNKLLYAYKEFLTVNKGFVNTVTTDDLILPEGMKTEGAEDFKEKIDDAIKAKDLSKLLEYADLIL
jgi:hypothetical protein